MSACLCGHPVSNCCMTAAPAITACCSMSLLGCTVPSIASPAAICQYSVSTTAAARRHSSGLHRSVLQDPLCRRQYRARERAPDALLQPLCVRLQFASTVHRQRDLLHQLVGYSATCRHAASVSCTHCTRTAGLPFQWRRFRPSRRRRAWLATSCRCGGEGKARQPILPPPPSARS